MALHGFPHDGSSSALTISESYSTVEEDPIVVSDQTSTLFYPDGSAAETYYQLSDAAGTTGIVFRFRSNDQVLTISSVSNILMAGSVAVSISSADSGSYIELVSNGTEYLVLSQSGAWG